jgi:hypothetical protein
MIYASVLWGSDGVRPSLRAPADREGRNDEQTPAAYEQEAAARRGHREQPIASKCPEGDVTGKQNGPQHPCGQYDGGQRSPEQSLVQDGCATQNRCRMKQQDVGGAVQSGARRHSRVVAQGRNVIALNEIVPSRASLPP